MRIVLSIIVAGMVYLLAPQPGLAAPDPQPDSQSGSPIGKHIIAQGDTLYSIARKYCMTPEELHAANRGVIGSNPDMLRVGMVLSIRNACDGGGMDDDWSAKPKPDMGGSGGQSGNQSSGGFPYETAEEYLDQFEVWDRGPQKHAMGLLNGMYYIVAPNDTLFSITQRFGIAESKLQEANGIHKTRYLSAGTHLYIPGLDTSRAVCKGSPAYVTIDAPTAGATVDATFTVRGRGCGLAGNSVVVRALRADGTQLTLRTVTLDDNPGAGEEGVYSAQLTITGYRGAGRIEVYNTESDVRDDVNVTIVGGPLAIVITSPADNADLPATFTVNVSTAEMAGQTITIAAVDTGGTILASTTRAISSNAQNVSVQLTVNRTTGGRIEAYGPNRTPIDSVPVSFQIPVTPPPFIQLNEPADNTTVPDEFHVSGRAGGLAGNQVELRAIADGGTRLDSSTVSVTDIDPATGIGVFAGYLEVRDYDGLGRVEARNNTDNVVDSAGGIRFGGGDATPTPAPGSAWLEIDQPLAGASLPARFTVRGRGRGLFEGNVVVRAFSSADVQLDEAFTTLQGANVGTGGEGTYAVELTVNTPTGGYIVVSGPQSGATPKSVNVGFNGSSSGSGAPHRDFAPGECRAETLPGAEAYPLPGSGTPMTVAGGRTLMASRVVQPAGVLWYAFTGQLNTTPANAERWIEASDLRLLGPDCAFP